MEQQIAQSLIRINKNPLNERIILNAQYYYIMIDKSDGENEVFSYYSLATNHESDKNFCLQVKSFANLYKYIVQMFKKGKINRIKIESY